MPAARRGVGKPPTEMAEEEAAYDEAAVAEEAAEGGEAAAGGEDGGDEVDEV